MTSRGGGRVFQLVGVLTLALIPLVGAWQLAHAGFVSNAHAHLVEKALIAVDRGRLELIGFVYPPLPFLLLLPTPYLQAPAVLGSLCAGALWWLLWRHLSGVTIPQSLRVCVLVVCMTVPAMLYTATASVADMFALLLLLAAWGHYRRFYAEGATQSGFLAGLTVGLTFFVSHYALPYALVFTAVAPLFVRGLRPARHVAAGFVLVFPVVMAFFVWAYINWVFTGRPLAFLHDPGSSLYVYARAAGDESPVGWYYAVRSVGADLVLVPLYLFTAALAAARDPRRAAVFLVPPLVILLARGHEMVYPSTLAVGTLLVVALAAMPRRVPRKLWPALAAATVLQLVTSAALHPSGEVLTWWTALRTGRATDAAAEEAAVGRYLAQQPDGTVLLDDRTGFRLVAQAGTARPFVLPADSIYPIAASDPARFVAAVVEPASSQPGVAGRAGTGAPAVAPRGFVLRATWDDWWLYVREERVSAR